MALKLAWLLRPMMRWSWMLIWSFSAASNSHHRRCSRCDGCRQRPGHPRGQGLGDGFGVDPRQGAEQDQLEEFVVGERLGAGIEEAVAQASAMAGMIGRAVRFVSHTAGRVGQSASA